MIATLEFVRRTFNKFNALCFDGVLPPLPFVLTRAGSFLGKVEYRRETGLFGLVSSNRDFRMKISTSFDLPEAELEDVVLHEMIHYYILCRNIKDTSVHGKAFRSIMEQLNERFGRNVTIRHKAKEGQGPVRTTQKPRRNYLCVTSFADGSDCITVVAQTRIFELHRYLSRCPDITRIQWYGSADPFFNRYPLSRTPKVYRISSEDLKEHLQNAVTFNCDGHRLIPE